MFHPRVNETEFGCALEIGQSLQGYNYSSGKLSGCSNEIFIFIISSYHGGAEYLNEAVGSRLMDRYANANSTVSDTTCVVGYYLYDYIGNHPHFVKSNGITYMLRCSHDYHFPYNSAGSRYADLLNFGDGTNPRPVLLCGSTCGGYNQTVGVGGGMYDGILRNDCFGLHIAGWQHGSRTNIGQKRKLGKRGALLFLPSSFPFTC